MKKLLLLMTTALLLQILPVSVTNSATAAGTASQPVASVSGHSVMPATPGSIASLRVREIVKTLHMTAHPEGGWFTEVYTAPETYKSMAGVRPLAGSIYFLLNGKDVSHFHQLDCDEIWYYHEGSGMRLYLLDKDGSLKQMLLGPNLAKGQRPMVIIPAGKIFAAENIAPSSYTLISCMTTPKFNYKGWRLVGQAELLKLSPQQQALIKRLS
jgi:predicted cupin superfamily sugar epimerase